MQDRVTALYFALQTRLQKTLGARLIKEANRVTEAPQVAQEAVIFPVMRLIFAPRKQASNMFLPKENEVALHPLKPSKQARNQRKQQQRQPSQAPFRLEDVVVKRRG